MIDKPQGGCKCAPDLVCRGKQLEECGGPGGVAEAGGVGGEDAQADALLPESLCHSKRESCNAGALQDSKQSSSVSLSAT